MNQNSHLAMRVPVALGALALVSGCYTVFSHPEGEIQMAETARYSDCASCHSSGFSTPILPNPYSYVATPFQDFYATPWWLPDLGYSYGGNIQGGGGASKTRTAQQEEEGRHVGGRGAGIPSLPPGYVPPGAEASTPAAEPGARPAAEPGKTGTPGQQSGRTIKESNDKTPQTKPPLDKENPKKEAPKDDSGD